MLIKVLMADQNQVGHTDKSMTAGNPEIWIFKKRLFNNSKYSNFKNNLFV